LNIVTLASSYSALPDDGDYIETCWSCFNVNSNAHFKQFSCASVGDKTLIIYRKPEVYKITAPTIMYVLSRNGKGNKASDW